MTFLWVLWWVALQLAVPIGVGFVTFRYWAWPLMQTDSPWQYVAYFASPVLSVASLVAVIFLCKRSIDR